MHMIRTQQTNKIEEQKKRIENALSKMKEIA